MAFAYNENRYGGRQMKLSEIELGKNKMIISCNAKGLQNERLMALGFIPGNVVSVYMRFQKH